MAFVLVVEDGTGLADANAFADAATVTDLLEGSPFGAAWPDVDPAKQDQCIAEASAWLSRLPWDGVASTATQALAWPRTGCLTRDGMEVSGDVVPAFLVQATARLALALSSQTATPYAPTGLQPGTALELPGGLKLTPATTTAVLPADVQMLVAPYVRRGSTLARA